MSMPMPAPGERVCITLPFAGLRAMQVCAVADATDEEILAKCNSGNPQQTTGGWHTVVRTMAQVRKEKIDKAALPGDCVECPGRKHIIALCM